MNTTKFHIIPVLLACLGLSTALSGAAPLVATVPQGYLTLNIAATNGSQTTTTYISLPLLNAPAYSAAITAMTTNSLSVSGTPWTAGQFAAAGAPYFVKMCSGQQVGRYLLVTANTTNTLTLDVTDNSSQTTGLDATGFAVQVGDSFQVIPGDTLASLLGDGSVGNPLQLVGGTSAFAADAVSMYSSTLLRSFSYYFNTTRNAWNSTTASSTTSQNDLVIYPNMALGILSRPNRPARSLAITGYVPDAAPLTKTVGGSANVIYSFTRFPVDIPLSALAISNWTKSNSGFTADAISVWDQPLARWDNYYQITNNQWRKSGDTVTDQSSLVIPAGTGIQIIKRTPVTGANSFLSVTMPYTLN